MERRRFLKAASIGATVSITGVAGCASPDGGGGDPEIESPEDTPAETQTEAATETQAESPAGTPTNETGTPSATGTAGTQQAATHYRFGGKVEGWQGREPQRIADAVNPTLNLEAGRTYKVTWENLDGAPHNFAIRDSQGNAVLETEIISEQGATQTTTFTATEQMTEYLCQVHPTTMLGQIKFGGG